MSGNDQNPAEPRPGQSRWGRDPARIPMVLAALERQWLKEPDARLGQVLVNLLRMNTGVPREDEGRMLFNTEDGTLLKWLGPETEAEDTYVREEPRRAREGWRAWERDYIARQQAERGKGSGAGREDSRTEQDATGEP